MTTAERVLEPARPRIVALIPAAPGCVARYQRDDGSLAPAPLCAWALIVDEHGNTSVTGVDPTGEGWDGSPVRVHHERRRPRPRAAPDRPASGAPRRNRRRAHPVGADARADRSGRSRRRRGDDAGPHRSVRPASRCGRRALHRAATGLRHRRGPPPRPVPSGDQAATWSVLLGSIGVPDHPDRQRCACRKVHPCWSVPFRGKVLCGRSTGQQTLTASTAG